MEWLNRLDRFDGREPIGPHNDANGERALVVTESMQVLLKVLAPIAPHLCHKLWSDLGFGGGVIIDAAWPEVDQAALVRDQLKLVVQVNGKRRAEILVDADAGKEQIIAIALADPAVIRNIDGRSVRKEIVVPGRLVNIVV